MEKITSLKADVLSVTKLEVSGKEYSLVLDMNAIAKAGEALKLNLADPTNWRGLTAEQLTVICWAALDRFHPDISLRDVRQWLSPVAQNQLFVMLLEQCWPGSVDRINKAIERVHAGETEPNPPSDQAKSSELPIV
jgi:hypothetical protein